MTDTARVETLGLPIHTAVCFSTAKNTFSKRAMKRQLKWLKPLVPLLRQFLEPEEGILLAIRGCSPLATLEMLGTGWVIYYVKRCVLVVTNKRILHIPTRINFLPKKSVAQVCYGDVARAKFPGFLGRVLTLKYKSGKEERFYQLPSKEFKKLKSVLGVFPKEAPVSEARQRHHLCPKCMSPLPKDTYVCPSCRLEFKSRRQAIRRSLLLPGGGYFYTGHPVLGIIYALIETGLMVGSLVSLVAILAGQAEPGEWVRVIFLAILLAAEKLLSIHHAKKFVQEYIPADQDFVPIKSYAR